MVRIPKRKPGAIPMDGIEYRSLLRRCECCDIGATTVVSLILISGMDPQEALLKVREWLEWGKEQGQGVDGEEIAELMQEEVNSPDAISEQYSAGPHLCHVPSCQNACRPEYLMCYKCWYKVPGKLRRAVYAAYREGQEKRLVRPTKAWFAAAKAAIESVDR